MLLNCFFLISLHLSKARVPDFIYGAGAKNCRSVFENQLFKTVSSFTSLCRDALKEMKYRDSPGINTFYDSTCLPDKHKVRPIKVFFTTFTIDRFRFNTYVCRYLPGTYTRLKKTLVLWTFHLYNLKKSYLSIKPLNWCTQQCF